ncbi:MAG TPA: hypothetical protein VGH99_20200 [Pseudonocardia sp.]|jgi:hypothetical protein
MPARLAGAPRRGAIRGTDLMAVDWFTLADRPVDEVRRTLGVPVRSDGAVAVGSVGPWEPGGVSPFQLGASRALARERDVPYQTHGAGLRADAR